MTLILGMAVLTAVAMVVIWAPAYPPARHEHMEALDRLARRDEPGRCWSCGAPVDVVGGCLGPCDPSDDGDLPW